MSSLYSAAIEAKAEQKANKSPRKQFHQFLFRGAWDLQYNLSQKCIL